MTEPLRKRWDELWQRLGAKDADTLFCGLSARYTEQHRAYHNLTHVAHCLEEFEAARRLTSEPEAVELAIWYHDIVYDPRAKDNENRSAELASKAIRGMGLNEDLNARVARLILSTKNHDSSGDQDAPVMVDVDLSILGAGPESFDEYERQIRKEYAWVSDETFAAGRSSVLKSFLNRPTIYSTNLFQQKYEQPARANLKRSLQWLKSQQMKA